MKTLLVCFALFGSSAAQFSSTAQTAIVKVHNDLRSKVAKGMYTDGGAFMSQASNMRKLKWDTTVAASAQKYANLCPEDHSGYPGLGENMYWSWTSSAVSNLNGYGVSASDSWEQEFVDYGWTSRILDQETFDSGIGHATQMVWAKTSAIGCGVKNCGKDASMDDMTKVIVVCQYKAQGNILDTEIYAKGTTCSACQSGTTCESASGLCA